jgi:hypothetical protein
LARLGDWYYLSWYFDVESKIPSRSSPPQIVDLHHLVNVTSITYEEFPEVSRPHDNESIVEAKMGMGAYMHQGGSLVLVLRLGALPESSPAMRLVDLLEDLLVLDLGDEPGWMVILGPTAGTHLLGDIVAPEVAGELPFDIAWVFTF